MGLELKLTAVVIRLSQGVQLHTAARHLDGDAEVSSNSRSLGAPARWQCLLAPRIPGCSPERRIWCTDYNGTNEGGSRRSSTCRIRVTRVILESYAHISIVRSKLSKWEVLASDSITLVCPVPGATGCRLFSRVSEVDPSRGDRHDLLFPNIAMIPSLCGGLEKAPEVTFALWSPWLCAGWSPMK